VALLTETLNYSALNIYKKKLKTEKHTTFSHSYEHGQIKPQ